MAAFTTASAQFSLSGLANKVKKAAKQQVEKTVNETVNSAIVGVNPCKDKWRIDSIQAYGVRTSNNFGKVWLVIHAEAIVPLKNGCVWLGGSLNQTYAVINGKTYKPNESADHKFEMPEGVPMVIDTKDAKSVYVTDVPASATEIQAYNMHMNVGGSIHKVLWKKIPITWIE